jgi:DNA replication protein DnaC
MTQQTLTRLRHLKLTGMADAVQQQLEQASTYEGLPFIERLSLLVEHEQLSREQRKQARLVKQARLKLQATVQEVDYQSARNLERSQVANLAQGEWLRRGQNLLITGPCGCGKTYLACALGYQACQQGHSTRYYRLPRLLLELSQAKVDGSYARLLGQLARIELLILDDWGLEAVNAEQRNACWRSWMIGMGNTRRSWSVSCQRKSGTRAWGQHSGRCDPGPADAQRSPAVTEGRIDEKEEK